MRKFGSLQSLDTPHWPKRCVGSGAPSVSLPNRGCSLGDLCGVNEKLWMIPCASRTAEDVEPSRTVVAFSEALFRLQGPTSATWSKSFLVTMPCTVLFSSMTGRCLRPRLRKTICALSAGVSGLSTAETLWLQSPLNKRKDSVWSYTSRLLLVLHLSQHSMLDRS